MPKKRPRKGKAGHFYTPKETRDYEELVAWVARASGIKMGKALIEVDTTFFFSDLRHGDGDNCHKSVLDALQNAGVIVNDKQVVDGHYHVREDKGNPRVEVVLSYV